MQNIKNHEEQNKQLLILLQSHLQGKVDEQYLNELAHSLFPAPLEDLYGGLLKAISTFYLIRILNKNTPFQEITNSFHTKCEEVGHGVAEIMRSIFEGEFYQKFKAKYANARQWKNVQALLNVPLVREHREEKNSNDVIIVGSSKPKDALKQNGNSKSANGKHDHKKQPNGNSEVDYVNNLAERGVCLCEKQVVQNSFVCTHCGHSYHLECMKKKPGARHCSICHLKRMLPNKEVKKVLFMGVLKKSKKKHEFNLYLSDEDLSMKHKLQVRCFRLKDATQCFVLFPDYTNVLINNYSVKEIQPLHRQSSLKYRKDDPFIVQIKNLLPKENKVVILEKMPSKEYKEQRIDVQNHLIGFFMIQDKKIEPLVKEITASSTTTFEESRKILDVTFRIGTLGTSDEVTCEVVKIPLSCTLSTERLKLPARGLFCTHYQCFDLYNFLIVTSSSANPKWICPLCKLPCYNFRIDSILLAILQEYAQEKGTEVMFFKSGDFTVNAGDKLISGKISNINELPISSQCKRVQEPPVEPERKKKRLDMIPENVISLDE